MSPADVLYSDFSGVFAVYADAANLGLFESATGSVGDSMSSRFFTGIMPEGTEVDNIDALGLFIPAQPANAPTGSLLWMLLGALLFIPKLKQQLTKKQ